MFTFILRRILLTLPVIFGVLTLTFSLIHFVPGDPIDVMLGDQASAQDKQNMRHALGLDRPLMEQYTSFMNGIAHADLGKSLSSGRPVTAEIRERLGATAELTLVAVVIAILIGIPLGVLAAVRQYSWLDNSVLIGGLLGMSLPGFWLGPMFIYIFSIQLDLLPVSGRDNWSSVILPAVSLGLALSAILMRMTRASMLEVLNEDFMNVARAKGLSHSWVYFKHGLRNAMMPVVTIIGLQFGALLTGTVVTETIFDWPGVGTLFYQGIQQRNYPLVQGCVLFIATVYVLVNLLTDIAYAVGESSGEAGMSERRKFKFRKRHILMTVGACLILVMVGVALLAPFLTSESPRGMSLPEQFNSPNAQHIFGQDQNGTDVFAEVIYGARISLTVALSVVGVSAAIGLILGSITGYFGGWVDLIIMRLIDMMFAFPGFLLAIALVAVLGPSLHNLILALCITGWTGYARLVRGEILHIKEREFVTAARALGAGPLRIISQHLWPNLLGPLIVQATFGMAGTIIAESALSFLGLGAPPTDPSWGALLNSGRKVLIEAPHISIFPGLCIVILVLGFNLFGDGLRDALDSRKK